MVYREQVTHPSTRVAVVEVPLVYTDLLLALVLLAVIALLCWVFPIAERVVCRGEGSSARCRVERRVLLGWERASFALGELRAVRYREEEGFAGSGRASLERELDRATLRALPGKPAETRRALQALSSYRARPVGNLDLRVPERSVAQSLAIQGIGLFAALVMGFLSVSWLGFFLRSPRALHLDLERDPDRLRVEERRLLGRRRATILTAGLRAVEVRAGALRSRLKQKRPGHQIVLRFEERELPLSEPLLGGAQHEEAAAALRRVLLG